MQARLATARSELQEVFLVVLLLLRVQSHPPLANQPVSHHRTILTGTPGIGKSIFYIYFFQRYRKKNPEINCEALYKAMVAFAKEGHYPGFQSITVADLTDHQIFTGLQDEYVEVMVSTWPTYYDRKSS